MKCPACGCEMIWGSDFDLEDIGMEEKGIVSYYTCSGCESSFEHIQKEKSDE